MPVQAEDIVVPDVDPDAFLAMLRYLYCDEISLEPDNVLATLYTAKKYIVPHLARECVRYLETSLKATNACLLLSQVQYSTVQYSTVQYIKYSTVQYSTALGHTLPLLLSGHCVPMSCSVQ